MPQHQEEWPLVEQVYARTEELLLASGAFCEDDAAAVVGLLRAGGLSADRIAEAVNALEGMPREDS